jgi:ABC-2 type transport system permease protein
VIQALVILVVGLALGVRVHGGAAGWLTVLAAAALLSMVFAGISNGIALLVRREATMIALANFIGLPLMFLSSILITAAVMPDWMRTVSRFNPVNWGVNASRNAVVVGGDWGGVGGYLGLLVLAVAVTAAFATWTFRSYQRSI